MKLWTTYSSGITTFENEGKTGDDVKDLTISEEEENSRL